MNDSQKLQYIVEILKQGSGGKEAADELKKVEDQSKKTKVEMNDMVKTIGQVVTAFAVLHVVKDWISQVEEAERATTRLNVALAASGENSQQVRDGIEDLNRALTENTTITKAAVEQIEAQLTAFGATADQLPELTRLIVDMGAAGVDAGTAINALGGGLNGQFGGLGRLLRVGFDDANSSAQNLAEALTIIRERYQGMAQAIANTPTGQLQQTRNAISDLKEELGRALLTAVGPWVSMLGTGVKTLNDFVGGSRAAQAVVASAMRAMVIAVGTLSAALLAMKVNAALARAELSSLNTKSLGATIGKAGGVALGASLVFDLVGAAMAREDQAVVDKAEAGLAVVEKRHQATLEEIQARKDLQKLEEQMEEEQLVGIDRELLAARHAAEERGRLIDSLIEKGKLTPDEGAAVKEKDYASFNATIRGIGLPEEAARAEERITAETQKNSQDRAAQILNEFNLRISLYRQWLEVGTITEAQLTDLTDKAARKRAADMAAQSAVMNAEFESLTMSEGAIYEQQMQKRIEGVRAYYNFEIAEAERAGKDTKRIEEQKTEHLEALMARQTYAAKLMYDGLKNLETQAIQGVATGITNAFDEMIAGTKSAKEAWEDFGRSFLKMIGDIILQLIITIALKSALKALGFADGGTVVSGGPGIGTGTPSTGLPAGTQLGASGLEGVQSVSSPTYFSRFNVLAGEAGREALTVLARPQRMEYGGISTVVGMAQGKRLMLVNADQGARAFRAAAGYSDASPGGGNGGGGVTGEGRLVIEVKSSPSSEARIIEESVRRADVQILKNLGHDTPHAQAVKRLVS